MKPNLLTSVRQDPSTCWSGRSWLLWHREHNQPSCIFHQLLLLRMYLRMHWSVHREALRVHWLCAARWWAYLTQNLACINHGTKKISLLFFQILERIYMCAALKRKSTVWRSNGVRIGVSIYPQNTLMHISVQVARSWVKRTGYEWPCDSWLNVSSRSWEVGVMGHCVWKGVQV